MALWNIHKHFLLPVYAFPGTSYSAAGANLCICWCIAKISPVTSVWLRNLFRSNHIWTPINPSRIGAGLELVIERLCSISFIPNKRKLAKATLGRRELSSLLSRVALIISFLFYISWSPWKHYESKHQMFPGIAVISSPSVPKFERVLERSMMACLLGLFRTERLAREMSAVTRVIDILKQGTRKMQILWTWFDMRGR